MFGGLQVCPALLYAERVLGGGVHTDPVPCDRAHERAHQDVCDRFKACVAYSHDIIDGVCYTYGTGLPRLPRWYHSAPPGWGYQGGGGTDLITEGSVRRDPFMRDKANKCHRKQRQGGACHTYAEPHQLRA